MARKSRHLWKSGLVAAAAISDMLDGFLAKRFRMTSELGAHLDPLADKAMLVSIYVMLAVAGKLPLWLVIAGIVVAFYDGLMGPGTGTFLIITLTALVGTDFVQSSATAKVINTGTNLGALAVFAAQGHGLWLLGLALAVGNVVGAQVGAHMALGRGSRFVRWVLLVVVVVMVAKLSYDLITG